jgi:spore coat polysaccharide biosynthesis protein SpsF
LSVQIVPVVLARLDSSRLPGKVLAPLLSGTSIIEQLLEQVGCLAARRTVLAPPIVATTDRAVDAPIVRTAEGLGAAVARGSLWPLARLSSIARSYPSAWIWRLNADSPLLLFRLIERALEFVQEQGQHLKVVSNLEERTFPYGISLEFFRSDLLAGIDTGDMTAEEREHVTPLIRRLPAAARHGVCAEDLGLDRYDPGVRLTIDDRDDAAFFEHLWSDAAFVATAPGSVDRVEFAYRKRAAHAP